MIMSDLSPLGLNVGWVLGQPGEKREKGLDMLILTLGVFEVGFRS